MTMWVNLEGITLSEINQAEKDITLCFHTYIWNQKIKQINDYNKNKHIHRYGEQTSCFKWEDDWERRKMEKVLKMRKLLSIK